MIKAFKKEYKDWYEIKIINMETGDFTQYDQDKTIGFTFSHYKTDVFKMGYDSVKICLKELKQRDFLGKEINYTEQLKNEKIGLINLGVEKIKRHKRVNTNDFKDVVEKLQNYGLGFTDAQNQIIAAYENSLQQAIL